VRRFASLAAPAAIFVVGCGGQVASVEGADAGEEVTAVDAVALPEDTGTPGRGVDSSGGEEPDVGSVVTLDAAQDGGEAWEDACPPTGCACTTDAGLVVAIETEAGPVEAAPCTACVNTSCAPSVCPCVSDTAVVPPRVDGGIGAIACVAFVGCVEEGIASFVATNLDAGSTAVVTAAQALETSCGAGLPAGSVVDGQALVSCLALNCASACF
jgi:hypothetical protein